VGQCLTERIVLIILPSDQSAAKLYAVSFDTVTYRDLQCFLSDNNPLNHELTRIEPDRFLNDHEPFGGYYINLISRDMHLRRQVTEHMDLMHIDRFSLIHENSYTRTADIGLGCMIYPMVSMYSKATLIKDIIVHSMTMIAHDAVVGTGSYISAGVNIAGTTKIGKFCQFGLASVIADHIEIVDDCVIGMATVVRESILQPGVYVTKANSSLTRLK